MEIIAEIGQNHNGDIGLACELIREAKICGADVAKFQVYNAEDLFSKEDNPWFEYNCKTELSLKDLEILNEVCKEEGIEFMASVFDIERISWLESLGVKRYKIASRSVYEKQLINAVIATGKPTLISLGMWEEENFPEYQGDIEYLFCISKYPTPIDDLDFKKIDFNLFGGFSDHTKGTLAPIAAMARGAKIIEKHFTIDKNMFGPDHEGSATPQEMKEICDFRDGLRSCL